MPDASPRPISVTALITRLGHLFMEDRIGEATRFWSFPCPVEVDGELMVMRDARALEAFFQRRRELARERGLLSIEPRIIAVEVPRDGRCRAWFRWVRRYADRVEEDGETSVYYMVRKPSGEFTIEMMDVVRTAAEAKSA